MKSWFVRAIAALVVGTGSVVAQGPAPTAAPKTTAPAPTSPVIGYYDPHMEDVETGITLPEDGHSPFTAFARGEFLLWNLRNANLPALVSTVPAGVIPVTTIQQGVQVNNLLPVSIVNTPSFPSTRSLDLGEQVGVRATIGVNFGAEKEWGLELGGFVLEQGSKNFSLSSQNNSNPFVINTGLNNILVVGTPNGGAIQVTQPVVFPRQANSFVSGDFKSQLWGADLNVTRRGCYYGPIMFSALTGVRYTELEESTSVTNVVTLTKPAGATDPAGTNFPDPLNFTTFDSIKVQNQFFGPQVGVEMDTACGGFFFNARAKVALGGMRQQLTVLGVTNFAGTGAGLTNAAGGLLSGPGDQGSQSRTRVACIPEINFKAGYQIGQAIRVHIGYDAMYLQHVVRPGGQTALASLDTQVSVAGSTQTIAVTQPVINMRDLDVWVQGINAGLEIRY